MKDDMIKCKVRIKKIIYSKQKPLTNGVWCILSAEVVEVMEGNPILNDTWGTMTLRGVWKQPDLSYGDEYTLVAKENEEDKYGISYEMLSIFKQVDLSNRNNQKLFLARILTEKQMNNLFTTIKDPIKVLDDHDIKTLCMVKGIGKSTAEKLVDRYEANKDYSTAYVELDKLGLTDNMVRKLCESYGNPNLVVSKINENPYVIADDVSGIGWAKADEIALKSGIGKCDNRRIKAYISYRLNKEANENGHAWIYTENLVDDLEAEFNEDGVSFEQIISVLGQLKKEKKIWSDKDNEKIALSKLYWLEKNIAHEIVRLVKGESLTYTDKWQDIIMEIEEKQGWKYGEEQKEGIKAVLNNNFILITGWGGSGKSSIVNGMLKCLPQYESAQCALSGKASVNLAQITGQEGYTIHRLLCYNPHDGWVYNKFNPLGQDIVILDELSMVDEDLFYKLIQSVKDGAKVIMLGDEGQLQNLGVGNLIRDLIKSKIITHVNLTEIHRQAKKSGIITDSIKIWKGEHIIDKDFVGHEFRGELKDFELIIENGHKNFIEKSVEYFKKFYKEHPIEDIICIFPMKRDVEKANELIQEFVRREEGWSPEDEHIETNKYFLYVGDRVINRVNNYKTENEEGENIPIFNGNMGVIENINTKDREIIVNFEKIGRVIIPSNHIENIELGYSITVHSSQGSTIPYVICAINNMHFKMLNKEILYTMITRCKKHCVLIGENKAIRYAVKHSGSKMRNTFLADFIKHEYKNYDPNNYEPRVPIKTNIDIAIEMGLIK